MTAREGVRAVIADLAWQPVPWLAGETPVELPGGRPAVRYRLDLVGGGAAGAGGLPHHVLVPVPPSLRDRLVAVRANDAAGTELPVEVEPGAGAFWLVLTGGEGEVSCTLELSRTEDAGPAAVTAEVSAGAERAPMSWLATDRRRERWIAFALFAAALACRLPAAVLPPTRVVYNVDELSFLDSLLGLIAGQTPNNLQWPAATVLFALLPVVLVHFLATSPAALTAALALDPYGFSSAMALYLGSSLYHPATLLVPARILLAAATSLTPVVAYRLFRPALGPLERTTAALVLATSPVLLAQTAVVKGDGIGDAVLDRVAGLPGAPGQPGRDGRPGHRRRRRRLARPRRGLPAHPPGGLPRPGGDRRPPPPAKTGAASAAEGRPPRQRP